MPSPSSNRMQSHGQRLRSRHLRPQSSIDMPSLSSNRMKSHGHLYLSNHPWPRSNHVMPSLSSNQMQSLLFHLGLQRQMWSQEMSYESQSSREHKSLKSLGRQCRKWTQELYHLVARWRQRRNKLKLLSLHLSRKKTSYLLLYTSRLSHQWTIMSWLASFKRCRKIGLRMMIGFNRNPWQCKSSRRFQAAQEHHQSSSVVSASSQSKRMQSNLTAKVSICSIGSASWPGFIERTSVRTVDSLPLAWSVSVIL